MSIFEAYKPDIDNPDPTIWSLMSGLGISNITARLLVNRGVTDCSAARRYLNPDLEQLHDPFLLPGIDTAVERINRAVKNDERITIYGDYDVDGLTSSTILYLYLKSLGGDVHIYIPNRLEEGYGLNKEALESIIGEGTSLIITVDCGITALDEVAFADSSGVDVIITDHHNPGTAVPDAVAVIDPKLYDKYPFQELAGVGVAAKLIQAHGGLDAVTNYLDLIAIGTVADVVPLIDENRVYVYEGLKRINLSPRPGIEALINQLGYNKNISASNISFGIAPVLNAPGRLSSGNMAFELLTSASVKKAEPIAKILVNENLQRRDVEKEIIEAAKEKISQQVNLSKDKVIVVAGEGWHSGVIGIVSSRITEMYNRPSIIISLDEDTGSGSARSIKGFNLYDALSNCRDLFVKFGGHEYAAGLTIHKDNLDLFRSRILEYADRLITDEMLIPHYTYDCILKPEDITTDLHGEIQMLAPFGMGNPAPKFLISRACVERSSLVGKESNHLKLALELGKRSWDAIGFNMADSAPELYNGCTVNLLASLSLNEWMGVKKTQFHIHGLKKVYISPEQIESFLNLFYFKFFNAFLSGFMYNNNIVEIKNGKLEDVLKVYDTFESSPVGTIVLVYDLSTAKELLNGLMGRGFINSISLSYNRPSLSEGVSGNTVVLAPDTMQIPFEHYHTVLTPRIRDEGEAVLPLTMDRVDMEVIYKWVRRLVPGRNIWPSEYNMLTACNNETGMQFSGFQLLLALNVFKELNFINIFDNGQYVKLDCVKRPESRSLSESKLFTYYKSWIKDFSALVKNCT